MSLNQMTRRVSDVADSVKRQFGDEDGVQLTNTDIIRWVNEAQSAVAHKLRNLKAKSTGLSVIGQADYTFPTDRIIQVESLHYKGVKVENLSFPLAEERIMSDDPDRIRVGRPLVWYEWANTFTLWPTPESVESITLYYTQTPLPVLSLTDLLTIPDKHFDQLVFYVMSKAYELDEEFEASAAQRQLFENGLLDLNDEERTAQHMTYSTITFIDD